MLKNYFRIAWRNLFRHKAFAASNLLGLTIGMTCSILIFLWVHDELSYDRFHRNYDNIFQLIANRDFKNNVFTDKNMVFPLAKSLGPGYPNIKNAVEMTYAQDHTLQVGDTKLKKSGYTVSEHFFDVFTWTFLQGVPAKAIADPGAIVLTASTAKALFGNEDPMGKLLKMDNDVSKKVSAVVADPPGNSTLNFDFVRLFDYSNMQREMAEWRNSSWNVFVQTVPGSSPALLEKAANEVMQAHNQDKISTYFAFPMNRWRLYSDFKDGKNTGGMIEYVRLFTGIAIIILLIACINFMNMSTARSEQRAKEVGIRKVLGASVLQMLVLISTEFLRLVVLAFAIAVPLTWWVMSNWLQKYSCRIPIDPWVFVLVGCLIGLLTLLVVCANTLNAAVRNPVKSLRVE
jgi:putative ABC transport system permease protein